MTAPRQYEYYRVKDVMQILGIKQSKAYGIIKTLNDELKAKGKITVSGRVSKSYFEERVG